MTANEFAREHGFAKAKKIQPWRGYECYEAVIKEPESVDDVPIIGLPQIILEKDGKYRFADGDEAMAYIDDLQRT